MGELPWGSETPSNINEGGNWRQAGDAEPMPKTWQTTEAPELVEKMRQEQLEAFLDSQMLKAGDILSANPKFQARIMDQIRSEVGAFKINSTNETISRHLEALDKKAREERLQGRKAN